MSTTLSDAPDRPFSAAPEANAEALAVLAEARRKGRRRRLLVAVGLGVVLFGLFAARVLLGDFTITVADFVRILFGADIPAASFIVMESKLPRALCAVVAGAAFGASGASFQLMLRNPLASPDILGIGLGASAAAVSAAVVFGASGPAVVAAAFLGAVGVAALIHVFAGRGGAATGRMILVGIGVAAALQSVVYWVLLKADVFRAQDALVWLIGSLSSISWADIARLTVLVIIVLPVTIIAVRTLEVLGLGDDLAAGLGVRVGVVRIVITGCVVVLTAGATAITGPIAFVAFLSGPLARTLQGGRPSVSTAAVIGACIVLAADYLAAYAVPGTNLPAGIVTGLAGAPFLLWLVISQQRRLKERA